MTIRVLLFPAATAALLLTAGCQATPGSTVPAPGAATSLSPLTPLTPRQQHWVDSTLASLSLRDRVGQMVMVWVLGDYTNTRDSSYAEVIRWVEQDHVGGVSMSLGTPIEV